MKHVILAVIAIAFAAIAFAPTTNAADTAGSGIYRDSDDVVMSWEWSSAGGSSTLLQLRRWADLNSDGDFLDTGENVLESTACSGALSCLIGIAQYEDPANVVTFKNSSGDHRPGNYTFRAILRNAATTTIDSYAYAFRINHIEPDCPPQSNCAFQHEETRLLVNQSYANVSANLTYLNTTGVFCLNCTPINETMNHTVFRSSIATDCHNTGGDFCVNGHLANVSNDTLTGMALFLGIMLILSYAAIQGGYVFPSLAVFGSLFVMLLMVAKIGIVFDNDYARVFSILIPLIPLAIGGFNLGAIVRGKGTPSPT